MQAAYITGYGGDEVVGWGPVAAPNVTPGHLVIDVHAAGVNPVEVAMRDGEFRRALKFKFPQVMGYDVSGVIRAVGPGVPGWRVGAEVYARLPNRALGGYAEQALVPAGLLARKPTSISHVEAASLPTVALTTWQAFHERAALKGGEIILIQPGAGGIGTFAIQLAKHIGAQVVATSGPGKQSLLTELGADHALDYTRQRFDEFGPYDVVYDGVGGDLIERSIKAVKPGGRYVGLVRVADARAYREIGVPGPLAWLAARSTAAYRAAAKRRDVVFHGLLTRPDGQQLEKIGALVDAGVIKPVVGRVFPLEGLRDAYREVAAGHVRGKLVVRIREGLNPSRTAPKLPA